MLEELEAENSSSDDDDGDGAALRELAALSGDTPAEAEAPSSTVALPGNSLKQRRKRGAPAAADLEALAAAAQEYAAARSNDGDAEPTARTVSAPPDESAAEPTLQESLETKRDQLLAWLSLSWHV